MKVLVLTLMVVVAVALADTLQEDIQAIQRKTKGEAFNRNSARIDSKRKTIDADFGGIDKYGPQHAELEALANRVNLMYANKNARAQAARNVASANLDGQPTASATKLGERGGYAKAGRNTGNLRLSNTEEGWNNADVRANGQYKLDTQAQRDKNNQLDRFAADGPEHNFAVDPLSQTETEGHGTLLYKDTKENENEFWLYEIDNIDEENEEFTALLSEDNVANSAKGDSFVENLFQRRRRKYRCQVKKVGESICYDQFGRSVGKTVATDDGEVVIMNKYGVPVARAKVHKDSDIKYRAVVNQGLMQARTENIQEYDCFSELSNGRKPTRQIEVLEPLTFEYNSKKNADGSESYSFPDCFQVGGRVKLPPGVAPWRVATEYVVNVLPLGKLKCMDVANCGRECYYCNMCNKTDHKLSLLTNAEGNVCDADGGKTHDLRMTVCPPPETFNWALCSKFSKSLLEQDYWQKKGDVDVQLRFYLRPLNEEQLSNKFHEEIEKPWTGTMFRSGLIFEWMQKQGLKMGSITPSNSQLKEYYIQKNSGKGDELIGCHRAVIKYTLSGTKVDTSFLVEASGASSLRNVFAEKPCAEWSKLDQEQYQREAAQAKINNAQPKPKPSGGGLFGGWFGRRA